MYNEQKDLIEHLQRETASLMENRARQREILSANLDRLHYLLADMTELHVSILEQMSQTKELLTIIKKK